MREKADVVRGWLRKADSDLLALDASLKAEVTDAACFHAQQAAEKYLKAFLVFSDADFPFTHNLSKLIELCAALDPEFGSLLALVEPLTPYAVEMRYDTEFWPDEQVALDAKSAASAVKDFVSSRLPNL